MFIDSSALIGVLLREPPEARLRQVLVEVTPLRISAASLLETGPGALRSGIGGLQALERCNKDYLICPQQESSDPTEVHAAACRPETCPVERLEAQIRKHHG